MRIWFVFIVIILAASLSFARNPSIYGYKNISVDNDTERPMLLNITNTTNENATVVRQRIREHIAQIRENIKKQRKQITDEIKQLRQDIREVYKNQNKVRIAVHALLSMENMTGGIGKNISVIARDFNNSIMATINAEKRIRTRNTFLRLFFGGDRKAANEIETAINRTSKKLELLKKIKEQCNCTDDVKQLMQEQIQQIEQEQTRLRAIAEKEKKDRGIFGWLFGWFGR